MTIYLVLGFEFSGWDFEFDNIFGAFTTENLARECVHQLIGEKWNIRYFEIHSIKLDEFGKITKEIAVIENMACEV